MRGDDAPVGNGVVWVAAALATVYVLIHVPMLYRSLLLWRGLLMAAVGQ